MKKMSAKKSYQAPKSKKEKINLFKLVGAASVLE